MRIAVLGAGAVGSFLGARLAEGGADVTLIARGAHLDALRERGLTLITPDGTSTVPVRATDDPAGIGVVDSVLFLVKSYDTERAARSLGPLLDEETSVVSLQNGVDNEERIAAVVGAERVVSGAIYILAAIEAPGVVRAGAGRVVLGELRPGPSGERVLRLVDALARGGVQATAVPDARLAKWEKYVTLVAFSAVTAATQLPIGDIRRSEAAIALLRAIITEAWQVGRALGVPLADGLVERQMALLLSQEDDAGSSLRHDLRTGHRMELEALQGTLSRLGRQAGVPTPSTDAAYAILEPWAIRNAAASGG